MSTSAEDDMFKEFNALQTGANGGLVAAASWNNAKVLEFLTSIGMPATVIAHVEELEVTGEDLITLTENELKVDLEITRLQAKKIKRCLGGNAEKEEAADAAELKAAAEHASSGVFTPPVDFTAADHPDNKRALQATSSMKRARAPAPPESVITVDAALVATWASKTALIAALEKAQVAQALPQAQQRLAYYKEAFNSERAKLETLMETGEELEKKHGKLEDGDWYIGKNLLGAKKRDEKKEKAEKAASEASRKVEAERKVVEDLAQKVKLQESEVAKLGSQVQALADAKRWEENALQSAFGGSAGDARENSMEDELGKIVPQVEQARRFKVSYAQAYELIRSARKQLDGADQAFQASYRAARLDTMQDVFKPGPFRNGPVGLVADMAKRQRNRQGVELCQQAAANIIRAAQIIPDMPRIDLQQVKGLQGMGFMDIVFDNIVTDMRAMRKIEQAMGQVQAMCKDIVYVERWLQGWLDGKIKQDLAALESAYSHKKAELDHYRRDLLQALVNAKGT